jgi:hypothetical protein
MAEKSGLKVKACERYFNSRSRKKLFETRNILRRVDFKCLAQMPHAGLMLKLIAVKKD